MPVQQFGELLSNPQKFNQHIIKVTLVAFALSVLAMLTVDQSLSMILSDKELSLMIRPTARIITDFALSEYYFILTLSVWAVTKWILPKIQIFARHPNKIDFFRRWSLNFLVAMILCGVITHAIKFLVGRQRPHKSPDFDPMIFTPFTTHWHWHSFSSGHSQVIFTVATMFSIAFPKWRWGFVIAAIGICFTRVIVHDHFLSDTIFGATVGYVGTLLSLKLMQKKTSNGLY